MKLYDLIKDKLKDPQGVISDNEICVLNRRDFLYSETSTSSAFFENVWSRASYLRDVLHN